MGLCSIIILTYNALEYTKMCYESILKYTEPDYELIFVDNGSQDGTIGYLTGLKGKVKVVKNHSNQGFAKGCNQGAAIAHGDSFLFLNNDALVTKHWLNNLLHCLNSSEKIGVVVPRSNFAAGASQLDTTYNSLEEMQQFAGSFNIINPSKWIESNSIGGFCLLIKRALFKRLRGFDEQFKVGSYEDIDLTLRAYKDGYKIVIAGDTFVHHFGNKTYQANNINIAQQMELNARKFNRKHTAI